MRLGAFDHLSKPIGRQELATLLERMLPAIDSTVTKKALETDDILIGSSEAIRTVQKAIGLLAAGDATVLIVGETGTGKELVARALHNLGRRGKAAFIAVNCAAIPSDLLESELFGHVRGAFTGATTDRRGAFREARGGTLFLDEIGDMPLAMQAKILRVLEERVVTPVGGRPVPVDIRILAASNRNLAALVQESRFRRDRYYRLNVVPIQLPPLRDRAEDIPSLAEHFLRLASPSSPKRLRQQAAPRCRPTPGPATCENSRMRWSGSTLLCVAISSTWDDLTLSKAGSAPSGAVIEAAPGDMGAAVAELEAEMIRRALKACGSNRAEAARRLNINRQLLYSKMRQYGLLAPEVSDTMTPAVSKDDS
jgi:two-component system NtrC family response regulator